jgi:hypothetical protein
MNRKVSKSLISLEIKFDECVISRRWTRIVLVWRKYRPDERSENEEVGFALEVISASYIRAR